MATTQEVIIKGHTIEWRIKDSTGVAGSTADIWWCGSTGGTANFSKDTDTYWMVKRVIFVPSTAQATGGYALLMNGGNTTGEPELVRFNMMVNESDVQTYDWDKPHRCQPVYASTLQNELTTGAKFIFHLA